MGNEPLVVVNSIVAVIVAVIAALINTSVLQLTPDQQSQLTALVVAIGAFVATFLGRSQVTPTSQIAK